MEELSMNTNIIFNPQIWKELM